MRIHVDRDLCQSHGQCVFAAPEVFAFDDDDNPVYPETVDPRLRSVVTRAAAVCPERAIRVEAA